MASRMRADYPRLALRTRGRRHQPSACHTPGCWHRVVAGKSFCKGCQETLDRVREELKVTPRGRKPTFRKAA